MQSVACSSPSSPFVPVSRAEELGPDWSVTLTVTASSAGTASLHVNFERSESANATQSRSPIFPTRRLCFKSRT